MQTNTELDLGAIKKRCDAATPGPWDNVPRHSDYKVTDGSRLVASCPVSLDARFIAHARMDIPLLVAEIERLRGELAAIGVTK